MEEHKSRKVRRMEEHKSRKIRKRSSLLSAGNCSFGSHLHTNDRSSLKIGAPTVARLIKSFSSLALVTYLSFTYIYTACVLFLSFLFFSFIVIFIFSFSF
jgi:hypothetical protein